jgi:histone H3/H4
VADHGAPEQLQKLGIESSSFSSHAVEALADRQEAYIEEVGQEAIRIARRNRADLVSAADVEAADQKLHKGSSSRLGLLDVLGGAIFGAGLSEFAAVMTTPHPGHLGIALSCGGMVIGLVGIAYGRSSRR